MRLFILNILSAAFLAIGAYPAIAQPATPEAAKATEALDVFNNSLRGSVCNLERGEQVIYGAVGDAITVVDGRVFYEYLHRRQDPYQPRTGTPRFEKVAFVAAFQDIDFQDVPLDYTLGDCHSLELYCKAEAPDCITETRVVSGEPKINLRGFVEVQAPTTKHVAQFKTLFKAAAAAQQP